MQHPRTVGSTTAPASPSEPGSTARHRGGAHPEVYRISAAPTAHTDDIGVRYRKYVVSMLVRTACFLLFVVVDHPVRWVFVAGAVFLPYVAVVLANAGREHRAAPPAAFELVPEQLPVLEAAQPLVVEGRIVEDGAGPRV